MNLPDAYACWEPQGGVRVRLAGGLWWGWVCCRELVVGLAPWGCDCECDHPRVGVGVGRFGQVGWQHRELLGGRVAAGRWAGQ